MIPDGLANFLVGVLALVLLAGAFGFFEKQGPPK